MKEEEIERIISSSEGIREFVEGSRGFIEVMPYGMPIRINKESQGVSFFYQVPFNPSYNYKVLVEFMEYAIPIISKMVEKRRDEELMGNDA